MYYLVSFWYNWSLWLAFFLLQLEEIQCLSRDFPFVAMSSFSYVGFRQFVAWNIHKVVMQPKGQGISVHVFGFS